MAFNIHPSTNMVKAPFNGNLNPNEVFGTIFNMIISQTFQIPELAHNYDDLVNKYKVDGTLYGDTKLFYATDVLSSHEWLGDNDNNILQTHRPDDPKCQAITIDQYRQIRLTTDNYLSKRAWSTEGAFSNFNSVILSMMGQTKKLYENTLFNVYVGTTTGSASRAAVDVPLSSITATGIEGNRLRAQTIAQYVADLLVDMKDYSRDFNDYGFMRAYSDSDLVFIWNSKYINEITKLDEPTIFHKDGLVDKMGQYVLPARYFGDIASTSSFATDTANFAETSSGSGVYVVKTAVTSVRANAEMDITNGTAAQDKHVFCGDVIPAGYIVKTVVLTSVVRYMLPMMT